MRHLSLLAALATMSACYPRYAIVQPALTLAVQDPAGKPVPGATVYFVAGSNPHHRVHHKDTYSTDHTGRIELPRQREWEWVAPIMIHGVPFYYWAWCVEKAGYAPANGSVSATEFWWSYADTITLQPGLSKDECREAFRPLQPR